MSIQDSIQNIRSRLRDEAQKAGRDCESVRLMAVSKFHSVDEIEEAIQCGMRLFGENRVQEAEEKFTPLLQKYGDIELHMIGSLQRNKVKNIVKVASCIESVDRTELIDEIEKQAAKIDRTIQVLFEFHTGEESKSGFCSIEELAATVEKTLRCKHIVIRGLMTMAPFTDDTDAVRSSFKTLCSVQREMQTRFPTVDFSELSMGMSQDFPIALQEGSTLVRIGTAIFGERKKV